MWVERVTGRADGQDSACPTKKAAQLAPGRPV